MYNLFFTDSIGQRQQLNFQANSHPNLMEFIRDLGYEDWGDCRGRAWCATCHIYLVEPVDAAMDEEEEARLSILSNTTSHSRLACQLFLDKKLHQKEIMFVGDD